MDTKFGMNVSNRMLLNAAKYQGYSFYRFWVIKGKPTGGRENYAPFPPILGLKDYFFVQNLLYINRFSNEIVFKFSENLEVKIVNDSKIG